MILQIDILLSPSVEGQEEVERIHAFFPETTTLSLVSLTAKEVMDTFLCNLRILPVETANEYKILRMNLHGFTPLSLEAITYLEHSHTHLTLIDLHR